MPGVERVELLLAQTYCKPGESPEMCDTGIAWDTSDGKKEGAIFLLDVDDVTTAEKLDDGSFRVRIEPSPGLPTFVERLVVLGYADDTGRTAPIAMARLNHVEIPEVGETWRITLGAVEAVPPKAAPPGRDAVRVHTWNGEPGSLTRCLVMEKWHDDGRMVDREFLVPPGDTDCDAVVNECDAYWWNSPGTSSPLSEASCATNAFPAIELPNRITPPCLLGGAACSELAPTSEGCVPVKPTTCLSTKACTDLCVDDPVGCIEDHQIAAWYCQIPTQGDGKPCVDANNTIANTWTLDLGTLVGNSSNSCDRISLAELRPDPTFTLGSLTLGTITVSEQSNAPQQGCLVPMQWNGVVAATSTVAHGLVHVPFSNTTSSIVALRLQFVIDGCETLDIRCTPYIDASDDTIACGTAPL